jgi:PTH1 family peptidyl-tRNA hydrolase
MAVEMFKQKVFGPYETVKWDENSDFKASIASQGSVTLTKSTLYVNLTGGTIKSMAEKEKIDKQDILVVCDDVNLELGKLRLRASGSAGGHHGLESIIRALDSEDFARLRIGVGIASMPRDLSAFVLEPFASEERDKLKGILDRVVQIASCWANDGFGKALEKLSQLQSLN